MTEHEDLPVDVAVVGGGVIGWSVASSLSRRGARVAVVEAGAPRSGSSLANAGQLVPSHVIPFAAPGMVRAGLTSLLKRNGAFGFERGALLSSLPWLWRFARSANAQNVRQGVPVLRELLDRSMVEVERLRTSGRRLDYRGGGLMQVTSSPSGEAAMQREAEHLASWGVSVEIMRGPELVAREPLLRDIARFGFLLSEDASLDPALLTHALALEAKEHGTEELRGTASVMRPEGTGVMLQLLEGGRRIHARTVVVAAGVWTPQLLSAWPVRLPVMPAKGHSVTLPKPAAGPSGTMVLLDERLAVTPLTEGVRVTGGYRLTTTDDRHVQRDRCLQLVKNARRSLRIQSDVAHSFWSGLRPATPDGLPIVDRMPGAADVLVATGHGMLGTSMGPGTGELVADMICDLREGPYEISSARFR